MLRPIVNGLLVLETDGKRILGIPITQVRIIKQNLEKGKPYWQASPMCAITRMDAAIILCTPWDQISH